MNLYNVETPLPGEERFDTLLEGKGVRIERIVSNSACTQWYDQEEDEWVVLLEGRAEVEIGAERVSLRRGDMIVLEAHQRHRVLSTSEDALWLTVFYNNG